jgi:hypothetical protein
MCKETKMISGVTYAKEYGPSKPMKDYMAGKISKQEYAKRIKEYDPLVPLETVVSGNGLSNGRGNNNNGSK